MPPRKKAEAAPEPEAPVAEEHVWPDGEPPVPIPAPPNGDIITISPTIGSLDYNPDGGRVLVDPR